MSEHDGRKVVVTTSIKGERMLKDRARGVADRLNVEFVPREGRPIRQISSCLLYTSVPMIPGTRTSPDEMFRETVCGLEDVPKGSEDVYKRQGL